MCVSGDMENSVTESSYRKTISVTVYLSKTYSIS